MIMMHKLGAKVTRGVDDMIMQSANDRMMTTCTMMMMMMMMTRMMIMRRDCENWIGCDDALEAEAG